jgi:hypothetical protein
MGRVASELLAAALATTPDAPGPAFRWTSADLGVPRVDLENKEAVRRALDDG